MCKHGLHISSINNVTLSIFSVEQMLSPQKKIICLQHFYNTLTTNLKLQDFIGCYWLVKKVI